MHAHVMYVQYCTVHHTQSHDNSLAALQSCDCAQVETPKMRDTIGTQKERPDERGVLISGVK